MAKKNTGKDSEALFVELVENAGGKECYVYRLTDTNEIKGAFATGFVKASPADFVLTFKGKMSYAEVKSVSDGRASFSFAKFTPAQKAAMKRQVKARGNYYVFFHRLNSNSWYMVDALIIVTMMDQGYKSIKWEDIRAFPIQNWSRL